MTLSSMNPELAPSHTKACVSCVRAKAKCVPGAETVNICQRYVPSYNSKLRLIYTAAIVFKSHANHLSHVLGPSHESGKLSSSAHLSTSLVLFR